MTFDLDHVSGALTDWPVRAAARRISGGSRTPTRIWPGRSSGAASTWIETMPATPTFWSHRGRAPAGYRHDRRVRRRLDVDRSDAEIARPIAAYESPPNRHLTAALGKYGCRATSASPRGRHHAV